MSSCFPALVLLILTLAAANDECSYYTAAVVEHVAVMPPHSTKPVSLQVARETLMKNVDKYEANIQSACAKNSQIIVFPEDGLYGVTLSRDTILPYLESIPTDDIINRGNVNPCNQQEFANRPTLQRLSCLAKNYGIAMVVNMGDVQPCHPLVDLNCPMNGRKQYNTDVAFDTDGRLLAKYHKQHLFFEDEFDTPEMVNHAIFTTSFGVRFGMFTCFDILFEKPALDLVHQYNVQNIIFPTAWINQFPHLSSTEVHQAWSRVTSTNLLAANLHLPVFGFTGSGIYSTGHVLSVFESYVEDKEALLVERVPINPKNTACLHYNPDAYNVSDDYHPGDVIHSVPDHQPQFQFQQLNDHNGQIEVCHNDLCCHANYSRSSESELYALGAFSGLDKSKPEEYRMQACLLSKCANSSISSCGEQVFIAQTQFSLVELQGNFSSQTFIYSEFLTGDRNLLPPVEIFTERGILRSKFGSSGEPTMLAATLYGRIFTE
jgi:pantetheine hydrolase